jgi:hypothetical protein
MKQHEPADQAEPVTKEQLAEAFEVGYRAGLKRAIQTLRILGGPRLANV